MDVLTVNGVEREYHDGVPKNIAALLAELRIEAATVVAEIDGRIIKRQDFADTRLEPGQKIELVRFVGGG